MSGTEADIRQRAGRDIDSAYKEVSGRHGKCSDKKGVRLWKAVRTKEP